MRPARVYLRAGLRRHVAVRHESVLFVLDQRSLAPFSLWLLLGRLARKEILEFSKALFF